MSDPLRILMARPRLALLLTLGVMAVVYFAGLWSMPLIDRDEPRYAQASKQMLESGDWVLPMYLDEPRLKKPIGIYWLQASSMSVLGATDGAARVPSAVAMLVNVAIMGLVLPGMIGRPRAVVATIVFASALLVTYIAKVCMTDATLLVGILTAQLCLYALWRGDRRWIVFLLLGIALGTSTLVKGPIALFYMGATVVMLGILRLVTPNRPTELRISANPATSWKHVALRVALVLIPVAIIVLPWLIAIELRIPNYVLGTINSELVERGKEAQEGHTGPPGFYLALIWGTYFPWSLLLPAAIWQGWKRRRVPWVRFALAAVIGAWVPLEVYKTKLPHYLLPAYPFLAILTADAIVRSLRGRIPDLTDKLFRLTSLVVGAVVIAAIPALLWGPVLWIGGQPGSAHVVAIALSLVLMLVTALVTRLLYRGQLSRAVVAMALGTGLAFVLIWTLYAPAAPFVALNQRVARHVAGEPSVKMVEYKEASIAFYQGGTIREESDADFLQTTDASAWPTMLVMTADLWQRQPESIRVHWTEVARERGITLAEPNQILDVLILRRAKPTPNDRLP